jgi:uncharacterized protein (DUF342 family)
MADMMNPPQVRCRIGDGGARAFLEAREPVAPGALTLSALKEIVREAGVVYGLQEDVLARVVNEGFDGEPLDIAAGDPGVPGTDGRVEYKFEVDAATPHSGSGEDATYVPRKITSIAAGETLAIQIQPEPGKPGLSVTGMPVAVRQGKVARLIPGPQTKLSEDKATLVAAVDGCPIKRPDGSIEVQPVVTLPGNLDYTIGAVDFIGTLVVRGDVVGDAVVKVKGSIEVKGNVEDVSIEAGGDITVHQGFSGHGKGKLHAGGNVSVLYVMNQTVIAAKDITIGRECLNATIDAGGKIHAPRALIAGGKLDAVQEIEVGDIGSMDISSAKIRVGRHGKLLEHLAQVDKDIKQVDRQIVEVKEAVYKLVKFKLDTGNLAPDKEQLLSKLQEAQKLLPKRAETLKAEKSGLEVELQKKSDSRIVVRGTIHKDTMVEVNGVRKFIESAIEGVIFVERAGALEARSV